VRGRGTRGANIEQTIAGKSHHTLTIKRDLGKTEVQRKKL